MGKYEKEIRLIPFLADISPALADEAERWICVYQYTAGETVRAPDGGCGILLMTDGRAAVYSADSDRDVLLRVLGRGGITGVANLFSDAPLASMHGAFSAGECAAHAICIGQQHHVRIHCVFVGTYPLSEPEDCNTDGGKRGAAACGVLGHHRAGGWRDICNPDFHVGIGGLSESRTRISLSCI